MHTKMQNYLIHSIDRLWEESITRLSSKWKFQPFRYSCELLMHEGIINYIQYLRLHRVFENTIISALMFFKCGKTNYMGKIFVHAASTHSITQVSQIFWVIVRRLRTSNIII